MSKRRRIFAVAGATLVCCAGWSAAQTTPEIMTKPWPEATTWGETFDRPLYESQGHVKGEDKDAEVFWWDSTGRFRFNTNDPQSLTLGYHWATMDFATHSNLIPNHLDDVSLAVGIPIFTSDNGSKTSLLLGGGYCSDTPFADINGLYGIGHLIHEIPLDPNSSLILSLDYNGNSPFMPDVPLPGMQYVFHSDTVSFGAGFPESFISWQFAPRWTASASYSVPYSADARLEYGLTDHVSLFGAYSNFFNSFTLDNQPSTDRLFYEMSRAELGVRYQGTIKGFFVDAALVVGYAFEQNFYRGFDARNLDQMSSISDEPYVGIQLVGRF